MAIAVRDAVPGDLPLIAALIRELGEYEGLAHEVEFDEARLGEYLFGARPLVEVLIGEADGAAQGFALFFHNFSTFAGRPGIWLEDLFVRPEARRCGLGRALITQVAAIAAARGCARFEWTVLDWNVPAYEFYRAINARPLTDWTTMRLDSDTIAALANSAPA